MALFKKKEKKEARAKDEVGPEKKGGAKKRLPLFLAILLILAGGGYFYMNYMQPKTPTYKPRKRVVKKKPRPVKKAAVKKPEAKKEPAKPEKAEKKVAAKEAAPKEAAEGKPTYQELEAQVMSLKSELASLKARKVAATPKKRPPREYRRLRAVFRKVDGDSYPGAVVGKVKEIAPGTVSFMLPELRDAGVEQVLITSIKGEREVTVVTTEESKLTNRIGWSGGLWSYSRNDKKDMLNGVALNTMPVEEYLKARETYRKALDIVYRALAA